MTIFIRCEQLWRIGIAIAATSSVIFSWKSAVAQIVPDNTLGAESSVVAPNVDIKGLQSDRIDGGAIRGANLFHSFQEFGVRDGRGAYFSNPAGIENIFSRVTGTNASNIFGKLGVLGNANLFLLNPNGIIFGPNASLDIGGSFVGSTANSLNFGDGKQFSATNPTAPPLLTVTVPLGVQFNQAQPSAIVNSGNLLAATGQNLTLLGGTVASTGQLSAPGGQVAIAAVPGGSVVNLSPSGQLLNIETSSPIASVGSSSLTKLLTSVDEKSYSGLTVKSDGQVELTGSDLPVVDGDVVARNVTAQTATLTANHNLTLVESQIGTTGDLNLLAGDTVRVRDSVTNPFVAQAGGKLLVQGRQGVDIFALNNSSSGLVSGGDMVLRSANTVGGDAHYWAGGSFRIEKLDGSLGGLFSPYDPVIRASGDVSFESYTGGSLHILAGGSVTIPGTVTITGADPDFGLPEETVTLSDGTQIQIDGRNFPTLDIRAGTTAFGTPNITSDISDDTRRNGANITIGSIDNRGIQGQEVRDQIFLTNQYFPNPDLPGGSIEITGGIPAPDAPNLGLTSIAAYGNNVTIDARGSVRIARNIITGTGDGDGGDVNILSGGIINTSGREINSSGEIINTNTEAAKIISRSTGQTGDVTLKATGNIFSGDIEAENNSNEDFSTIRLESSQGSVFLNAVRLTTTNTGSNYAGDIFIDAANNVEITGNRAFDNDANEIGDINISTEGFFGRISINAGSIVSITDSRLTAQVLARTREPSETVKNDTNRQAGNIRVTSTSGNVEIRNSSLLTSTLSEFADPGSIFLTADRGKVLIQDRSFVESIIEESSGGIGDTSPQINIRGNSVEILGKSDDISNFSRIDTRTFGIGKGADVFVRAISGGAIKIENSVIDASTQKSASGEGGNISLIADSGGSISLTRSTLFTDTFSSRNGGNINISAENGSVSLNSFIPLETRFFDGQATLVAKVNQGASGRGGNVDIIAKKLSLEGGSSAITSSDGSGNAGDVTVRATESVILRGTNSSTDFRLFINQPNQVPREGLLAEATQEGGIAGNLRIETNELKIENGAAVTVSSPQGQAGNIEILANKISLNNGAILATTGRTSTTRGEGANIFLLGQGTTPNELINLRSLIAEDKLRGESLPGSPLDLLHLGNESLIAANARTDARGGNVAINTQLLIALPPTRRNSNGSDISANANQGRGGVIAIRAQPLGIYGIEFREGTTGTSLNDITATSVLGPDGIVSLRLPDVDPRRGLLQLPEDLGDSSRLITQSCPVGRTQAASRFVVTGRGGLPPSPSSALSSDALMGTTTNASPRETRSIQSSFPGSTLVEAKGVNIGPKGEIIFTANPSKSTSDNSWQRNTGCNEK